MRVRPSVAANRRGGRARSVDARRLPPRRYLRAIGQFVHAGKPERMEPLVLQPQASGRDRVFQPPTFIRKVGSMIDAGDLDTFARHARHHPAQRRAAERERSIPACRLHQSAGVDGVFDGQYRIVEDPGEPALDLTERWGRRDFQPETNHGSPGGSRPDDRHQRADREADECDRRDDPQRDIQLVIRE